MYHLNNFLSKAQNKISFKSTHSNEIQQIIDYYSFSLGDICDYIDLYLAVPKSYLNQNSFLFEIYQFMLNEFIVDNKIYDITFFYIKVKNINFNSDVVVFVPNNKKLYNKLIRVGRLSALLWAQPLSVKLCLEFYK